MTKLTILLAALLLTACGEDEPLDRDGDGFIETEDCDDWHATVHPGAVELCNQIDDDCDGEVDEEPTDAPTWYTDADGDGWGQGAVQACAPAEGEVASGGDCDDADPDVNPGALEDCADADADGWAACEDCDDTSDAVFPGADELCNGLDDDCDGRTDAEAIDAPTWHQDHDGDGFGGSLTVAACEQPAGYVSDDTDCDDHAAAAHPGGVEVCDGLDNDCDGTVDLGASTAPTWYADTDGDGFGDADTTSTQCDQPSGYVADPGDCDDTLAGIHPAATELCDGLDNDCDETVDEDDAVDTSTWYVDDDGDGWGDADTSTASCEAPSGYVDISGDCDDTDEDVSPDDPEYCSDSVDNDCDGTVGEDEAVDASWWYADADGDGYGDDAVAGFYCEAPSGYVATPGDCDDTDATISPSDPEWCADGIDNDCDGSTDESDAVDATEWWVDADGDGYGAAGSSSIWDCEQPSGWTDVEEDCDDADADVNPGEEEVCNDGKDNDCDGGAPECRLGAVDAVVASSEADAFIFGRTAGHRMAIRGGIVGDLDGDGYDDLGVGAPAQDYGSNIYAGAAYFLAGSATPSTTVDIYSAYDGMVLNTPSYAQLGFQVVAAGDVTRDGSPDVLVLVGDLWVSLLDSPLTASGSVSSRWASFASTRRSHTNGTDVVYAPQYSRPGDWDGDGYEDVILAAWSGWATSTAMAAPRWASASTATTRPRPTQARSTSTWVGAQAASRRRIRLGTSTARARTIEPRPRPRPET